MAELYKHMGDPGMYISYAEQRLSEIKRKQEKLEEEKQVWEEALKYWSPLVCSACNGKRRRLQVLSDMDRIDGPRYYKCADCNGTGKPSDD